MQISIEYRWKATWNQNLGVLGPDDGDRNKGFLEPGYWCDQRESNDKFTLDSSDFLLQRGMF